MSVTTTQNFSAWNAGNVSGALAVSGATGSTPDATIGTTGDATLIRVGPLYQDAATPNEGTVYGTICYEVGNTQTGNDNNVIAIGHNKGPGGLLDVTKWGAWLAVESEFDIGSDGESGNLVEIHLPQIYSPDHADSWRPLTIAFNKTTEASQTYVLDQLNIWDTSTDFHSLRRYSSFLTHAESGGGKEAATQGFLRLHETSESYVRNDAGNANIRWLGFGSDAMVLGASGFTNGTSLVGGTWLLVAGSETQLQGFSGSHITVHRPLASPTTGSLQDNNLADRFRWNTTGIGLYTATPVAQHSSTGQTSGFTAGSGTAVNDDSTFTGGTGSKAYTVGDIVRALKLLGAIASS